MTTAFLQRVSNDTAVAHLDMRVKFALLVMASTIIFIWNNLLLQALVLVLMLALMLAARVPAATIRRLILILSPALIMIAVIQGLWSPFGVTPVVTVPDSVPWVGGWHIFYVEGLLFGLAVCCRLLIPMLAFQLVFMTSDPRDIVLGLARIGVPYRVAFLFSTTFRFVPLLFEEMEGIKEAQRLRGVDIDSLGLVRKLIAMARMLVPLVMICLSKAQLMEIALQAKAFTGSGDRTYLHPTREQLSLAEKLLIAVFLLAPVAALAARLVYGFGGSVL
ncbi:energy-coupling factor transporter transmembrane component T family protein [Aestuariivirga sp. YIM B02566]|uniref:Energy-coupling factor transporter transmembrane protein EcfT n=1 Tax=Taklimakanibacter albus TaxID=2800327 RepID=A0ACC5R2I2_9HYPH|nr:energy-coupling factor transporter transmembrane component T [Aestuariivirga sp. YIM B02566]MBK1866861.1 energy-coupling factor transporter transmembrane protein EcfT [Aestuariivirga sp. YIM B02566]